MHTHSHFHSHSFCTHSHICIHRHTHSHTYAYTLIYTRSHKSTTTDTPSCTHTCLHTCPHTYTCAYAHSHILFIYKVPYTRILTHSLTTYIHLLFSRSFVSDSLQPHGLHGVCQASLSFTISWSVLKLEYISQVRKQEMWKHLSTSPIVLGIKYKEKQKQRNK